MIYWRGGNFKYLKVFEIRFENRGKLMCGRRYKFDVYIKNSILAGYRLCWLCYLF